MLGIIEKIVWGARIRAEGVLVRSLKKSMWKKKSNKRPFFIKFPSFEPLRGTLVLNPMIMIYQRQYRSAVR